MLPCGINFEMWAPYHNIWPATYGWSICGMVYRWNYTEYTDNASFGRKYEWLTNLSQGRYYDPNLEFGGKKGDYGWATLAGWPEPDKKQAAAILKRLHDIYDGTQENARLSWDKCVSSYQDLFYPHRRQQMQPQLDRITALWKQAFAQAESYQMVAQASGLCHPDPQARRLCYQLTGETPMLPLKSAQKAVPDTIKEITSEAGKIFVGGKMRQYVVANQAVRSRVFRGPAKDEAHKHFVDGIVKPLEPAIREMAQNEFKEGILIRSKDIDQATKEASETIARLLA